MLRNAPARRPMECRLVSSTSMSVALFYRTPENRQRLRVGPLAPDIDGFAAWVASRGYRRSAARHKLRLASGISRWLEAAGLDAEALDEQRFAAFLRAGEPPPVARGEAATGRQLLAYLRERGRVPAAVASEPGPAERIVREYERFLVDERGLGAAAIAGHLRIARSFLADRFGTRAVDLESLAARDASRFLLRRSRQVRASHAQLIATVLRSFLGYLHQRGLIAADFAGAVLSVARRRSRRSPRSLAPDQVESLLDSCDRSTEIGRRDHAILQLLARLGLRAGEVVRLTLDDLNWDEGTVTVSGKGGRREALPLPREAGEALAEYLLRGRPACATRVVFLRVQAPRRGFRSSAAICDVVRRGLARAGIDPPFKGSHLLRHSLACNMLRNGASLEDIGQILRHRHPDTTQIYARVDFEALRPLAPPWPGGTA